MDAIFRNDKSRPTDGTSLVLAFDHESQEYLQGNQAYRQAVEVASKYGFGGAATKDVELALLDAETDEPVVQFDPARGTKGWRGFFTFIKRP